MLIDLNQGLVDTNLSADLCIVGAGAAGITLAREFIGTACSIVMLEGGGRALEVDDQDTYKSEVIGLPHAGIHSGRARAFGGTTLLWAGQALPLFDIDFEQRDWVPYSGWPLTRAELLPYYRRAENVMQIKHVDYGVKTWPRAYVPPYDTNQIDSIFSQFTAVPNFEKKYGGDLRAAANIRVILHANVTSLEADQSAAHITEVRARSLGNTRITVRSKYVVLCMGGIETARLLLLSDALEKNGLGNQYDVVGRFFQDHPHISFPVKPRQTHLFHRYCDSFRKDNIRLSLKLVPSAHLQRREQITNVGAEVYYPTSGEDDPLDAAKALLKAVRNPAERRLVLPSLASMARDPIKVLSAAYRYYVQGQPASVGSSSPRLGFSGEQEPNPHSRLRLSREKDRLGMRRASLDWKLGRSEPRAVEVLARAIRSEWNRLGIGELEADLSGIQQITFADYNHHIGTTRMGANRELSVVDPQCRVHGYDNLYIGSSATFPTGGFSNPTLTVIALVLRIADELKACLARNKSAEVQLVMQNA
jgi:choline dehydrogenase-like flavoprotein